MASNVINAQIQEAYDTEANWIAKNTVLLKGQLAFSSDKQGYYKVGNGTSTWSQLPYAHVSWANIDGKPSTFYTHPSSTAYANGLYKITTNSLGHVTGATAVTKADITALGIPAQDTNTVYTHPNSHAATMITQDASHRFVSDTEKSNWNAAKTHADSTHAPANAEVNQNAFSNVKVGTTTIAADAKTDTLELVGSNVTLTPDATNDKVTIGLTKANVTSALGYTPPTTDTKYTHPTTAGNKHIPAGGSSGQILRWSADGTAAWGTDNNTTYGVATDSNLGLVKSGGDVSVASTGLMTVTHATKSDSTTKLAAPKSIALSGGAVGTATNFDGSANISVPVTSVKEAYLSWGGKNFSGTYGCIDAAMVPELGANRFAFLDASGITIEYSRDSGATWTDYGCDNYIKTALFSSGATIVIGKADTNNKATAAYQLRITINTSLAKVYTELNKFCLFVSTNGSGGVTCTISAAIEASPTSYTTFADSVPISGCSGYNIINTSNITTYGNTSASQYGRIRFTFKSTGGSTQYYGLQVLKIMGFGGVGWATPSNMAKTGHIYSYDASQNVTFPGNISTSGNILGNVPWTYVTGKPSTFTPSSHTHTKSQITDFPAALKNPTALTISLNGTSQGAYDGSAEKSFNITAASVGAAPSSHTHSYAGSGSAGGSANSAVKLDTATAGSSTQPVYFSGGKPVACSYTLAKSVPSNAVFTDTNTWIAFKGATSSAAGTAGYAPAPAAGAANRYLRSDGTWAVPPDTNTVYTHPTTAGNKHIPSGGSAGQFLKWSSDGTAVWANDNNTTYGAVTQTANGLMTYSDKIKLDGIATGANNYTHPSSHAASMITQDATHRFVSDTEKTNWNGAIDKIDDVSKSLLEVVTVHYPYSVTTYASWSSGAKNISKSGYTPIGFLSFDANNINVQPAYYYIGNDGNLYFAVYNHGGYDVSAEAYMRLLYKKNY